MLVEGRLRPDYSEGQGGTEYMLAEAYAGHIEEPKNWEAHFGAYLGVSDRETAPWDVLGMTKAGSKPSGKPPDASPAQRFPPEPEWVPMSIRP